VTEGRLKETLLGLSPPSTGKCVNFIGEGLTWVEWGKGAKQAMTDNRNASSGPKRLTEKGRNSVFPTTKVRERKTQLKKNRNINAIGRKGRTITPPPAERDRI